MEELVKILSIEEAKQKAIDTQIELRNRAIEKFNIAITNCVAEGRDHCFVENAGDWFIEELTRLGYKPEKTAQGAMLAITW